MSLHPIPLEHYWAFAEPQFAIAGNRHITHDVVEQVYNLFYGVTANVQRIMNMS